MKKPLSRTTNKLFLAIMGGILYLLSFSSHAESKCSLTGNGFNSNKIDAVNELFQDGSKAGLAKNRVHPECGKYGADGLTDWADDSIQSRTDFEKPNPDEDTKFYKNVSISNYLFRNESNALMYKIIVKKIEKKKKFNNVLSQENKREDEKVLWEISANLPLTEDQCIMAYADPCDKETDDLYEGSCFKPCIAYGPQFLGFNEKTGKLYFAASSASIGTGGGPYFLFVGDLKTKEIKFLEATYGPLYGSLSPSGTYLLLISMSTITIYNTTTWTMHEIHEKNNWDEKNMRLHYLGDIVWLSDSKFRYQDAVKHSKFQPSNDEVKESVYDINTRKVIQFRMLSKKEFNSTPYVEPR